MTIEELLGKIVMSDLRSCNKIDGDWDIEIWLTKLAERGHENGFASLNYPEMIRALANPKAKVELVTYSMSTAMFTIYEKSQK